jgi:hypothetical protein
MLTLVTRDCLVGGLTGSVKAEIDDRPVSIAARLF